MKAIHNRKLGLLLLCMGIFFIFSLGLVSAAPEYSPIDVSTPIFLIIGIASVLFLFAGIWARSPLFTILGAIGILICGFLMMQGHILINDGHVETVIGNVTTVTPVYVNWSGGNNELFGFFIVVAMAGLLWTLPAEYSGDD